MVSIQKFLTIVLVSNRIEYWSNNSIRLEILNIRTALEYKYITFCHYFHKASFRAANVCIQ